MMSHTDSVGLVNKHWRLHILDSGTAGEHIK